MASIDDKPTQSYPMATFKSTSSGSGSHLDHNKEFPVARAINRTPSPTPSEEIELKSGALNWKTLLDWRFWLRKKWLWYYVAFTLISITTVLVTIFHKQIVHWLEPAAHWLHDVKLGWTVPIAVLFVISFPPLFGHEIVAILCGLVWGLWAGFGIVVAGSFLGEIGNFYAFKYCCRSRGEKLEKTKIFYGALARVVRDGGFMIALIARLSAIPGHFTTAVFASCGMGIIMFSIAALLSMPKQFITVYLGVILGESETGKQDKNSKYISDGVLVLTILITVGAMWYILRQVAKVKPQIIYERRKARQAKMEREGTSPYGVSFPKHADSTDSTIDPRFSESEIPLTAREWDKTDSGSKFPYGDAPRGPGRVHSPQPQRVSLTPRHDFDDVRRRDIEEGAGAVKIVYPDNFERKASGDLAGWDMSDAVKSPLPPSLNGRDESDRYRDDRRHSRSPSAQQQYQVPRFHQLSPPEQYQLPAYDEFHTRSTPTPTQANVSYPSRESPRSAERLQRLPLPTGLHVPAALGHGRDATDSSYVTAYSDDGHGSGEGSEYRTLTPPSADRLT